MGFILEFRLYSSSPKAMRFMKENECCGTGLFVCSPVFANAAQWVLLLNQLQAGIMFAFLGLFNVGSLRIQIARAKQQLASASGTDLEKLLSGVQDEEGSITQDSILAELSQALNILDSLAFWPRMWEDVVQSVGQLYVLWLQIQTGSTIYMIQIISVGAASINIFVSILGDMVNHALFDKDLSKTDPNQFQNAALQDLFSSCRTQLVQPTLYFRLVVFQPLLLQVHRSLFLKTNPFEVPSCDWRRVRDSWRALPRLRGGFAQHTDPPLVHHLGKRRSVCASRAGTACAPPQDEGPAAASFWDITSSL